MSPERQILQRHIQDTIDRLHGHALQIDRAGAGHRRERVKLYQQKPEPGHAYEAYEKLARLKAKDQFPKAEDELVSRMAVSFARRRIRFDYLKEHQKKRAVESSRGEHDFPLQLRRATGRKEDVLPKPIASGRNDGPQIIDVSSRFRGGDQHTVYSATVNTKLELRPEPVAPQRAESVVSVLARHDQFPPAPQVFGASFQCPYCRLDFRASEAKKERWM